MICGGGQEGSLGIRGIEGQAGSLGGIGQIRELAKSVGGSRIDRQVHGEIGGIKEGLRG